MNTKARNKWIVTICVALIVASLFSLAIIASANEAKAGSTITIDAKTYEFDADNGYNFSSASEVSSMSFGKEQLGSLSISGEITDTSSYRSKTAYGVSDNSQISFSYSYDGALLTDNKDEWHLIEDTGTTVDGVDLSGSVGKGVMIVQKSSDGSTWIDAANPVVNFYSNNSSGKSNFYTTSGTDVAQGMFYRVIMAYKTTVRTSSGFVGIGQKWETKKHVELYEFYLAVNSGTISIHNLAIDEGSLPEVEGYTPEVIKRAETLLDGSTTTQGFSIDKLSASYVVQVSKDGTLLTNNAYDGESFTENGKYTVKTVTKLGKTLTQTIYVFNGGENKGYSTYFGESIIDGKRVFRYGDYPSYARGAAVSINAVADNIPSLTGTITNLNTNVVIELTGGREAQKYSLSTGTYCADFYNSTSAAGSVYHYTFFFNVIDDESAPFVNYDNLMKTERFSDLGSKHYEVAYETTAGGYIFVCFSQDSYEQAFNYAYEIEKRFIENTGDGLYYKSRENPQKKVKYLDFFEMTDVLNYYARKNVEYNYFNALDVFTYRTYDNDLLEELESLSIRESIRVFPSQAEKDKLITRRPFINDFTFVSVGDYDVVSVDAYCYKNGRTYSIELGRDVSTQLTVSSKYKITETNVYGDTLTYEAYYVNDNQTKSVWNVTLGGVTSTVNVSSELAADNKLTINADTASIASIENALDPMAIVTIKAPEVYSFEIKCLVSELENVGLYKKGTYELTFVDRLGNSYQLIINISGKARYDDVATETVGTYTSFHNTVYKNPQGMGEEIMLDAAALRAAIKRTVEEELYPAAAYANYEVALNAAIAVYENPDSTQEEIDAAASNLEKAYDTLVVPIYKMELLGELEKFEMANKGLYTTATYATWENAYKEAIAVYYSESAIHEDVTTAIDLLKNAVGALVQRGDKSVLYTKLQEIKTVDCLLYTPQTIEALNDAYELAMMVFGDIDATQPQIDGALATLNAKQLGLCAVADFSALLTTINAVKDLNPKNYTEKSINTLKSVYDAAVSVYKNRNLPQADVNAANAALSQAKAALVLCGDRSELLETVTELSHMDHVLYTQESVDKLHSMYLEALALFEGRFSQAEIDAMVSSLETLKSNLVIVPSRQLLYEYLLEVSEQDLISTSDENVEAFKEAYWEATTILCDPAATVQEVEAVKQKVKKAYDGLMG